MPEILYISTHLFLMHYTSSPIWFFLCLLVMWYYSTLIYSVSVFVL